MADMYRVVWEGWRPIDFIREMELEIRMIMGGASIVSPGYVAYKGEHYSIRSRSLEEAPERVPTLKLVAELVGEQKKKKNNYGFHNVEDKEEK